MPGLTRPRSLATLGLILAALLPRASAHGPGEEMAEAARQFLAALTPAQREKAQYPFPHEERFNWHFVPRSRNGVSFKEMTPGQRLLGQLLMASGLSARGYLKANQIMSLEEVLREIEGPRSAGRRDPELYYITVFGEPGHENTWGWRIEGHHLAFNLTIVDGHHISGAPSFLGSNPAEVRDGPRQGLRILAAEEDLARALMDALSPEQRRKAIFTDRAPNDIITGADRKAKPLELVGISYAELDAEQQEKLLAIVREYANRLRPEVANRDLARIAAAGLEKIHFGWAGSTEKGQRHYYRAQGPTFLLEYDNVQNQSNHIHAVWRDLENDFGEDLLRQHYEKAPHPH